MARVLLDSETDEAIATGYRAIHFAHTVGTLALSYPSFLTVTDPLHGRESTPAKTALEHDVAQYVTRSPRIDELIYEYKGIISPTLYDATFVEQVAGWTFLAIDRPIRDRAIDVAVIDFAEKLDLWPDQADPDVQN
jgi:hypothetical protein